MTTRIKFWQPKKRGWFVILVTCLISWGCARSAEIIYYQLSAITQEQSTTVADTFENKNLLPVIGIGPVRFPQYLDRPQIVTRLDMNRLQLADSHRWAEPLNDNISWILKENLGLLLVNNRLYTYPWPQSVAIDRQLIIDIIHFEGDSHGTAQLVVVWTIKNGKGEVLQPARRSKFQGAYSSSNYSELTEALSEALALFCREAAEELQLLPD
jgi:hypothetical protein